MRSQIHFSNSIKKGEFVLKRNIQTLKDVSQIRDKKTQTLKVKPNNLFNTLEKQLFFMDNLFNELKLRNLDDWMNIQTKIIIKNGGRSLISYHYSNNLEKLLTTLYPNFPWQFFDLQNDKYKHKYKIFHSFDNQRTFMNNLFNELKLKSLDEWLLYQKKILIQNGGRNLLIYYENNFEKLLSKIYPQNDWQFDKKFPELNEKFNSLSKQRLFALHLAKKLNIKSLDDWLNLNRSILIEQGGKEILNIYSNSIEKFLISLYPNHCWKFDKLIENSKEFYKSIENQQIFMTNLFYKLKFKSIENFFQLTKEDFIKLGGKKILYYYANNFINLLLKIYPNFPWNFQLENIKRKRKRIKKNYLKSIENQRKLVDHLFIEFNLISIDNWSEISANFFILNGGKKLLSRYSNNMKKMLRKIYPNFPWKKEKFQISPFPLDYFLNIENQRLFIDDLYKKLRYKSLDNFLSIAKKTLRKFGGENLLLIYSNNLKKLLKNIFPYYKWEFDYSFTNIFYQRKFFDQLFKKLRLKRLKDWIEIKQTRIINKGGKELLQFYSNDMKKLLSNLYPNYPWNFSIKIFPKGYFNSIENQRQFMLYLYDKYKLNSLDDFLNIKKLNIIKNGGNRLLKFYLNDIKELLKRIFPNYPFNFEKLNININRYFRSLSNQRKFMDNLFIKLKLKSFDDWLFIKKKTIYKRGGRSLLFTYYNNNMNKLLLNIYPNHLWNFEIDPIEKQRRLLEKIGRKLGIKELNDWLIVKKSQILINGGKKLLLNYSNDLKKLLITIYPNHQWNFDNIFFRRYGNYFTSVDFRMEKLKYLQKKYLIQQKKDWYRLQSQTEEINLYQSLKLIYPTEKWNKKLFQTRTKKTNQRLLFILLQQIFSIHFVIENYRHDLIQSFTTSRPLEFDIFIPSLNMGFEYQGEQHYDDLPDAFAQNIYYNIHDQRKEDLANTKKITLIIIPYWWDQSLSSLLSTIHDQSPKKLHTNL